MRMDSLLRLRFVSVSVVACGAFVAGCEGGGGGATGGTTPPPPPPPTFTVGGTLAGLATGASVVLQNNGVSNLTLSNNGAFTFPAAVNGGGAYAVTVLAQPSNPAQTCAVTSGSGTLSANVTNVAVDCVDNAPPPPPTFVVGGSLTGLAPGASVVLQNNGAANLAITADGGFNFPVQASGTAYAVTVLTQPATPAQTCTVTNGTGTVGGAAVTNVAVACVNVDQTPPTVTGRTPLPGSIGTRVQGSVVTVRFSEAINPQSVNPASFSVSRSSGPVAGEITFANGNTQAIFTPGSVAVPATLEFDHSYTVTVTTAVRDMSNNPLPSDVVWSFNTGKKIAAKRHNCVRFGDGRIKCWGLNNFGQLGYDDTQSRGDGSAPLTNALPAVNLGAGRIAVALAAGDDHTCAILDNGDTKCWGRNLDGELGQGHTANVGAKAGDMEFNVQPVEFGPARRAVEIAAGKFFTCARLDDNTVKCWGRNSSGQLGQGNTTPLGVTPGDIATAQGIDFGAGLTPVALSLAHNHACALLKDDGGSMHVKCWGDNAWGELGLGHTENLGDEPGEMGDALADVDLGTGVTVAQVDANGGHTCAVLGNGAVKCWGLNTWGQGGLNAGNSNPVGFAARQVCTGGPNDCIGDAPGEMGNTLPAAIAANVDRLSAGFRHNCAWLSNGQMRCWGSNEEGQLGLGDNTGAKVIVGDQPGEMAAGVATALKAPVEELTAGAFHTCVWNTDDTLNCWGDNPDGELGHNDTATWGDGPNEMGASLPNTDLGP
jgi:alpha-tubulin suppressor-like RCC1 family protein